MQVTIEIPDALAMRLQTQWRDMLSHYVFERIVMEGYRDNLLTTREVQELLGLDSRFAMYALCGVRQAAVNALAEHRRVEDVPLFRHLAQSNPAGGVRQAAINALVEYRRAEDVTLFRRLAQSDSAGGVRRAAGNVLLQMESSVDLKR